jgi:hypothetical protein
MLDGGRKKIKKLQPRSVKRVLRICLRSGAGEAKSATMSRPTTLSRPITERSSAGIMGDPALTQAPGPNRAVPFLPGMSYGNPARRRFPKSHIFEFKVGVGRSLAVMGTEVRRYDFVCFPCAASKLPQYSALEIINHYA